VKVGSATIDIGVSSATETEDAADANGWLDDFDLQTAGVTGATTDATLTMGDDAVPGGELYITNGSIDILECYYRRDARRKVRRGIEWRINRKN